MVEAKDKSVGVCSGSSELHTDTTTLQISDSAFSTCHTVQDTHDWENLTEQMENKNFNERTIYF